jgi:ribosomal protein S13
MSPEQVSELAKEQDVARMLGLKSEQDLVDNEIESLERELDIMNR